MNWARARGSTIAWAAAGWAALVLVMALSRSLPLSPTGAIGGTRPHLGLRPLHRPVWSGARTRPSPTTGTAPANPHHLQGVVPAAAGPASLKGIAATGGGT